MNSIGIANSALKNGFISLFLCHGYSLEQQLDISFLIIAFSISQTLSR